MVLGAKEGQGGRCMVLVLEGGMMHGGDGGGGQRGVRVYLRLNACTQCQSKYHGL